MEALSQQIFNTENIIKIIDSDGSYDLLNELYPDNILMITRF